MERGRAIIVGDVEVTVAFARLTGICKHDSLRRASLISRPPGISGSSGAVPHGGGGGGLQGGVVFYAGGHRIVHSAPEILKRSGLIYQPQSMGL